MIYIFMAIALNNISITNPKEWKDVEVVQKERVSKKKGDKVGPEIQRH